MKKLIIGITCMAFLSSCFIFRKKEKYGCPSDGRNIGAEQLAAGDEKGNEKSSQSQIPWRQKKLLTKHTTTPVLTLPKYTL